MAGARQARRGRVHHRCGTPAVHSVERGVSAPFAPSRTLLDAGRLRVAERAGTGVLRAAAGPSSGRCDSPTHRFRKPEEGMTGCSASCAKVLHSPRFWASSCLTVLRRVAPWPGVSSATRRQFGSLCRYAPLHPESQRRGRTLQPNAQVRAPVPARDRQRGGARGGGQGVPRDLQRGAAARDAGAAATARFVP